MKRIILATVFSLIASPAFSQKVVPWELLAVPYSTTPDGLYSPQFPSYLDAYELQEVVLQGYLVPVDVEGSQYALSRYAFSSCFFLRKCRTKYRSRITLQGTPRCANYGSVRSCERTTSLQ